ncbi:flagellar basal-body rod protein FlgB [Roseateles sp. YR242]|uniref:flagellar basal body rod protein FlgB n=1 Tax=Roseateles sp. YR242 TaxID=1855305 RepID=UPI0008D642EB|nr:flagellar basal body protein [Roseateles sp. YR242]SEK93184.1 flagellar basal-body rod protein FlgB [Roseateles sp. YR242]
MTQGIEAVTTASLSLALDAATLRQQVIAANIANANSIGYVPQRASFEAQIEDGLRGDARSASAPVLQVRIEPEIAPNGGPAVVHVDTEVAAMAENNLHYQALVRGLNRHLSILSSAVSEGKR